MIAVSVELLACPRCKSAILQRQEQPQLWCENHGCGFHDAGFPLLDGMPVLVDFDTSILDRAQTLDTAASSPLVTRKGVRSWFKKWIDGLPKGRRFADFDAKEFIQAAKRLSGRPKILVIGGGSIGEGADLLYADPSIELIGTDIYATPNVSIIADGHNLPLRDGSIHAVWIQAVLEHVLEPSAVVAEIHRVLAPSGIVYAETPFMQQVHEAAWDFTRFSMSGHRWLFKHFSEISSGVVRGPATTLLWAIRYFAAALTGSYAFGYRFSLLFFWLKYFERAVKPGFAIDGASGIYFFGRRSEDVLAPKDMVAYYRGAQ